MDTTTLLIVVGVFVLLVAVVAAILIRGRRRSKKQQAAEPEALTTDKTAVLKLQRQSRRLPALGILVELVKRSDIPRQLEQADVAREVSVEDVARMKLMMMAILGALGLVVGLLLGNIIAAVLFLVGGLAIGFRSPNGTIAQAALLRQNKISRALPLALEVIGLAVERTSIDTGIAYYCRYFQSEVLAQELGYVVQRTTQLKERLSTAMEELLRKNRNDDLTFLVAAVGQATQVGGRDLKDMLKGQSVELRIKREQEVKARSLRAPVLMTFPTMINMLALLIILGSLAFLQIGNK
ncbi:MAG: type II secretion system F family protein [Candidatus Dormibacteria bacterium]